ncbi:MAG: type pilus assembly protein PilN [Eubacteriales bacterium]|nr:type pilus assembly protein PilN [Eubacteriales bacterium]MDN5364233.1 type pilus assembly protein PilN [Eubacteriales bacterium]
MRDINLLPQSYRTAPVVNVPQVVVAGALIVFLLYVAWFMFYINLSKIPELKKDIATSEKLIRKYSSGYKQYQRLKESERIVSNYKSVVESLNRKRTSAYAVFREQKALPEGVELTGSIYQSNGSLIIKGLSPSLGAINELVTNINRGHNFNHLSGARLERVYLQDNTGRYEFEISCTLRAGGEKKK